MRTSYQSQAENSLDRAIQLLGDIKATGPQLTALNQVYELLIASQSKLESAIEVA
jgi:hypothetical protein